MRDVPQLLPLLTQPAKDARRCSKPLRRETASRLLTGDASRSFPARWSQRRKRGDEDRDGRCVRADFHIGSVVGGFELIGARTRSGNCTRPLGTAQRVSFPGALPDLISAVCVRLASDGNEWDA